MDSNPRDGKKAVNLRIEERKLQWLLEMTVKYKLPDPGKTLRIVILYARQHEQQEEIFAKMKSTLEEPGNEVERVFLLDKEHESYLEQTAACYGLAGNSQAIRFMLDHAVSQGDADTIFGIKRCKHGSTCACAQ